MGGLTFRRGALRETKPGTGGAAAPDNFWELCLNHTPPPADSYPSPVFEVGKTGYGELTNPNRSLYMIDGAKYLITTWTLADAVVHNGKVYQLSTKIGSPSFFVDGFEMKNHLFTNGPLQLPPNCKYDLNPGTRSAAVVSNYFDIDFYWQGQHLGKNTGFNAPKTITVASGTYYVGDSIDYPNSSICKVMPPNSPPVVQNATLNTVEDVQADITLPGSDPDGNLLTYQIVSGPSPSHGAVTISGGKAVFTPASNWNGSTSFTYKANDGTVDSNTSTVQVNVAPVNDPPVASNAALTTAEGSPGSVVLSSSDIEGDALTYHLDTMPNGSQGTVSLNGNSVVFTPAQYWNGTTSFTFYTMDSGGAKSNVATVNVTVTPALAGDQTILQPTFLQARFEDGSSYREAMPGETVTVTIRYREPDTSKAILIFGGWSVTQSTSFVALDGTAALRPVSGDPNGMILAEPYLPHDCRLNTNSPCTNFSAEKTYVLKFKVSDNMIKPAWTGYTIVNGQYTAVSYPASPIPFGPRKVSIAPFWGPPCNAQRPAGGLTYECYRPINMDLALTLNILGGEQNKKPVAQDLMKTIEEDSSATIQFDASDAESDPLTYSLVSGVPASIGSVTISGNSAIFTPAANWNGSASFTYKASDAGGDSNTATVVVNVTPVNDRPSVDDRSVLAYEDASFPLTLTVSDPDIGIEGDSHTWEIVDQPSAAHGSASITGGILTFVPSPNWSGSTQLKYRAIDSKGALSDAGVINFTVAPINDPPDATPLEVTTPEDTSITIQLLASDIDSPAPSVFEVVDPPIAAVGVAMVSGGQLIFTPAFNWHGVAEFKYRAQDNQGAWSSPVPLRVTVTSVNDAPQPDGAGLNIKTLEGESATVKYLLRNAPL